MDANNRISGISYDAAGNQLGNGVDTYQWDAESRMKSLNTTGATYSYDASGMRVRKQSGSEDTGYVYFPANASGAGGGQVIAERTAATGSWTDYIFAGGRRLAKAPATSATSGTEYYHGDHLGPMLGLRWSSRWRTPVESTGTRKPEPSDSRNRSSSRMMSNATGASIWEATYLPYGQEHNPASSSPTHYKFTGKERDSESGLDYFGARYYASSTGRFLSADPDQISGFEYEDDPQAWNGYTYVRNNPLNLIDPDGRVYQICGANDKGKVECVFVSDTAFAKMQGDEKSGKTYHGSSEMGIIYRIRTV